MSFFDKLGIGVNATKLSGLSVGIGAVTTALSAVLSIYNSVKQAHEETVRQSQESLQSYTDSANSLKDYIDQYDELKQKLDSGDLDDSEIYSTKQQILEIQQSIVSEYGNQAAGIDLVNGKLQTQLGLLRNISTADAKTKLNESQAAYDDAMETLEGNWTDNLGFWGKLKSDLADGLVSAISSDLDPKNFSTVKSIVEKYAKDGLDIIGSEQAYDIKFTGNAEDAAKVFDAFMTDLRSAENQLGANADVSDIEKILSDLGNINGPIQSSVSSAKEIVNQFKQLKMATDDLKYSDGNEKNTAADWYYKYADSVTAYNDALASGDSEKISSAANAFSAIDESVQALLAGDMSEYKVLFDEIAEQLDKSAIAAQDFEDAINGKGTSDAQKQVAKYAKTLKSLKLNDVDFMDAFSTDGVQKGEDAVNGMVNAAMQLGLISDTSQISVQSLIDKLVQLGVIQGEITDNVQEVDTTTFEELLGDGSQMSTYVDNYIKDISKLQEALEKFKSGKLENADIAELMAEFPELADGSDTLGESITNLINRMNADAIAEFADQFGSLETQEDVEKLKNYENAVLAVGKLPTSVEFSVDVEYESSEFDKLTTAMQESVSAAGLAAESIENLKKRYQGLDSFNAAKLFENTANGIHLNTTELQRLETEYINTKKAQNQLDLNNLTDQYNDLTARINACNSAAEAASLYAERATVEQRIQDCQALASQYDGLTSAYNRWKTAQSGGSERDMYENIGKGFDSTKELIEQGWGGSEEVRSFVDLVSNKDMSGTSAQEIIKEFNRFFDNIGSTKYSIADLFKFDDDGNITSEGIQNFFKVVQSELGEGYAKLSKDGSLWFDFGNGKDQDIADKLGVSVEVIQSMLKAAIDAGINVSLDSVWDNIDLTTSKAEQANAKLNELAAANGLATHTIDFDSTDIDQVNADLEIARSTLDYFRNADGTIRIDEEGAEEAQTVLAVLIAKRNELTKPAVMQIDYSEADGEMAQGVKLLQNYWSANSSYEAYIEAGIDASGFEEDKQTLLKEIQDFSNEHPEIAASLGIDTSSEESLLKSIDNISPTVLASLGFDTSNVKQNLQSTVDDAAESVTANATVEVKLQSGELDLRDVKKSAEEAQRLLNESIEPESFKIDFNTSSIDEISDDFATLYKAKKAITENDGQTPLAGMEKEVEYINLMMSGLLAQKDSLTAPFIMSVDTSGAEGEIYTVISELQTLQSLINEKGRLVTIGADTSEVQSQIDSTVANINNASPEIKASLGLDETSTAGELLTAVAQIQSQADLEKIMLNCGVNQEEVDAFLGESSDKDATVVYDIDTTKPDSYKPKDKTGQVSYYASATYNGVNLDSWTPPTKYGKIVYTESGGSNSSGTAAKPGSPGQSVMVNGSAHAAGTAHASGDWRTKKTEVALTGELGPEIVVDPNSGTWHTVGDNGAQFENIPKGAIVFNHKQTEALLKYGKVSGRGKSFLSGTAFSSGSGGFAGSPSGGTSAGGGKKPSFSGSSSSSSSSSSSASSDAEEFSEQLDWIETLIDRIERRISKLSTTASSTFHTLETRLSAVSDEMSDVSKEIEYQRQAYETYMAEADAIPLSDYYKQLVQSGDISLENITDEDLNNNIQKYKELYEKALDARDAVAELDETQRQLVKDSFDMTAQYYDDVYSAAENNRDYLQDFFLKTFENGSIGEDSSYSEWVNSRTQQINTLKETRDTLKKKLDDAVSSGKVEEYSEAWYEMYEEVQNAQRAVSEFFQDSFNATIERIDAVVEYVEGKSSYLREYMLRISGNGSYKDDSNYQQWLKAQENQLSALKAERDSLIADLEKAVASGEIKEYSKAWYEMMAKISKAQSDISELYKTGFTNAASRFDAILGSIESRYSLLDTYVSNIEESGHIVNVQYYQALAQNKQDSLNALVRKKAELIDELNRALDSGEIKKYSQAWYEMQKTIDETDEAIIQATYDVEKFNRKIRQLKWDQFDDAMSAIEQLNDEADFYIDVLSRGDKLFDDKGKLTDNGTGVMGLHVQKYETYMQQAAAYDAEIKKLDKEIEKDPYNEELINRRNELIKSRDEAIKSALDEKDAVIDLVEEGIKRELEALSELIDKYKDALDAAKDAYDYNKKVKDQTKEIADLEKQIASYRGDTSEETKATVQKLKVSLEEAKSDLEATQYEQYVSDQKELLDDLYDSYSETLNSRLDDIDSLFEDCIKYINENGSKVMAILNGEAGKLGITVSDPLKTIWESFKSPTDYSGALSNIGNIASAIKNVVTQIEADISERYKQGTVQSILAQMKANSEAWYTADAATRETLHQQNAALAAQLSVVTGKTTYSSNGTWYDKDGNPLYTIDTEKVAKEIVSKMKVNSASWKDASASKKKELEAENVRLAKSLKNLLGKDVTRSKDGTWYIDGKKLFDVYHSGGIVGGGNLDDNEKLAVLLNHEAVLTNDQLADVSDTMSTYADIIKNLGGMQIPNPSAYVSDAFKNIKPVQTETSNVTTNSNNSFDISFTLPNVKSYEEFMNAITGDSKFEKFLQSVTVDRVAGKPKLSKDKYRW